MAIADHASLLPHRPLARRSSSSPPCTCATTAELLDVIVAADAAEDYRTDGAFDMVSWLVASAPRLARHRPPVAPRRQGPRRAPPPARLLRRRRALLGPDRRRHEVRHPRDRRAPRPPAASAAPPPRSRRWPASAGSAPAATPRIPPRARASAGPRTTTSTATATPASCPPPRARSSTPPSSRDGQLAPKDAEHRPVAPFDHRCADALVDLCRRQLTDDPGPDPPLVVVHVDADVLDGIIEGNGTRQRDPGPARHRPPLAVRLPDRVQRRRPRRHLHRRRPRPPRPAPLAPPPHPPPRPRPLPVPRLRPQDPPDPPHRVLGARPGPHRLLEPRRALLGPPPPRPRRRLDPQGQRRRRAHLHQPLRPHVHQPPAPAPPRDPPAHQRHHRPRPRPPRHERRLTSCLRFGLRPVRAGGSVSAPMGSAQRRRVRWRSRSQPGPRAWVANDVDHRASRSAPRHPPTGGTGCRAPARRGA